MALGRGGATRCPIDDTQSKRVGWMAGRIAHAMLTRMIRNIPLPFRHCKVWPSGSRFLLGRLLLWLVVASLIPALYGTLANDHLFCLCMMLWNRLT